MRYFMIFKKHLPIPDTIAPTAAEAWDKLWAWAMKENNFISEIQPPFQWQADMMKDGHRMEEVWITIPAESDGPK